MSPSRAATPVTMLKADAAPAPAIVDEVHRQQEVTGTAETMNAPAYEVAIERHQPPERGDRVESVSDRWQPLGLERVESGRIDGHDTPSCGGPVWGDASLPIDW